jgi:hypothetical protein
MLFQDEAFDDITKFPDFLSAFDAQVFELKA